MTDLVPVPVVKTFEDDVMEIWGYYEERMLAIAADDGGNIHVIIQHNIGIILKEKNHDAVR